MDSFFHLLNFWWASNRCRMLHQALGWRCGSPGNSIVIFQRGKLSLPFCVVGVVDWLIQFLFDHSSSMFFSIVGFGMLKISFPMVVSSNLHEIREAEVKWKPFSWLLPYSIGKQGHGMWSFLLVMLPISLSSFLCIQRSCCGEEAECHVQLLHFHFLMSSLQIWLYVLELNCSNGSLREIASSESVLRNGSVIDF